VAVVTEGRGDEREDREGIDVEIGEWTDLLRAVAAIVGPPEVQNGDVPLYISLGAARRGGAVDVADRTLSRAA